MTLSILLLMVFNSNAQQQIKVLNAFQHYKIQASNDYNKLLFLVHNRLDVSPFEEAYFNDWEDAFLVVNERETYSIRTRYHIFEDEFHLELNGKQQSIYPHLIQGIVFKNRIFVPRKEMLDSGLKDGYYELLSGGKQELLKKRVSTYKLDKNGNLKLGKRKEQLYTQTSNGVVEVLDLTAKKNLDIFGEHQLLMKSYAKNKDLDLNKISDLKRLFDYYNQVFAEK